MFICFLHLFGALSPFFFTQIKLFTPPKFSLCSLNSCVVSCSINGQYMKQGKLGAAVLGNHTTKEVGALLFSLLLYAPGLTFVWFLIMSSALLFFSTSCFCI